MRIQSKMGRALIALMVCAALLWGWVDALAQQAQPDAEDMAAAQAEEADDGVVYDPEEEESLDDLTQSYAENADALEAVGGMTNILLIGLDARPGETTGRSDTMILLTLDAEHNCIKLTSFMRDLYVEIPGRKNNRLNAAYVFGGPELLMKTMKKNFGIEVDHYVAVNFSILADVIDQLGGLVIDVPEKYLPRINAVIYQDNLVLGLPDTDGYIQEAGEQLLTGKQAQAYARYRYGTPDGDFGRTVRQREVVLKCLEKIKSLSMTELVQLAINNLDNVSTDMSVIDMITLAPAAFQLKDSEVRELRIPIDGAYSTKTISGMWVMVPNRNKNLKAITEFLLEE